MFCRIIKTTIAFVYIVNILFCLHKRKKIKLKKLKKHKSNKQNGNLTNGNQNFRLMQLYSELTLSILAVPAVPGDVSGRVEGQWRRFSLRLRNCRSLEFCQKLRILRFWLISSQLPSMLPPSRPAFFPNQVPSHVTVTLATCFRNATGILFLFLLSRQEW